MRYSEMRKEQQREFDEFSRAKMFFAFNKEQFNDGLAKLGCTASELASVGFGGFVKNEDFPAYKAMNKRHSEQMKKAIADDTTGDGFIFDMFNVELSNHEFSYTGDPDDAISACGLSTEDFKSNPALLHGLQRAMQFQMEVDA